MDFVNGLVAFFDLLAPAGVIRLASLAIVLYGLWLALGRTGFDSRTRLVTWLAIAVPVLMWLALVWNLALAGVFLPGRTLLPVIPLAIFLPVLAGLILLMRSARFAAVIDTTPPSWLVGMQAFRVFGGIFLLQWMLGNIPGTFALPAGGGDLLVGLLALPVAIYLYSAARGGRAAAYAFNVLGIADFAVAITIGVLVGLRVLPAEQSGAVTGAYPLVMIPTFSVPFYLILHFLSLWQLRRLGRREKLALAT